MASFLFCTRILRNGMLRNRSSSQFLSFDAAREHMQSEGLRSRPDFLRWSYSGNRPTFIPSNPDRTYRGTGWSGYPDFLGYVAGGRRRELNMKRVEQLAQAEHAKDIFIDSVTHLRPDIEIKRLPPRLGASHIFRISDARGDGQDRWIAIQARYTKPNPTRGGPCFRSTIRESSQTMGVQTLHESRVERRAARDEWARKRIGAGA